MLDQIVYLVYLLDQIENLDEWVFRDSECGLGVEVGCLLTYQNEVQNRNYNLIYVSPLSQVESELF